tara:strand:+ start:134 stop:889 length:756 start_codon:yes stop_codon:yes gene_type:complete
MKASDIDKAICLCLDTRQEHWLELEEDLGNVGIKMERFIAGDGKTLDCEYDVIDTNETPPKMTGSVGYSSWWTRPNAYNAFKCHIKMFEKALEDGCERVLMLEDDAILTNDFEKHLKNVVVGNWDALYLGWYQSDKTEFHVHGDPRAGTGEHYFSAKYIGGLHGMVVDKSMLPTLVEAPPLGPMDHLMGTRLCNNFNYRIVTPQIILQKPAVYSEVEGQTNWSRGVKEQFIKAYGDERLQEKHRSIVEADK